MAKKALGRPPLGKDVKTINFQICSKLWDSLDNSHKKSGKSKTRILEDALTEYFKNH